MLTSSAAKYTILDVPKFHPRFDIHGSNGLDAENTYAVVSRAEHASAVKMFVVRLHFYRVGWWRAGVLRLVGGRYRQLWIGPMPAYVGLEQRNGSWMKDVLVSPSPRRASKDGVRGFVMRRRLTALLVGICGA